MTKTPPPAAAMSQADPAAGLTIALDGPAASGKTTVGHLVAQRLGFTYFDTGLLYRAVTLLALRQQASMDDEPRLGALAANMAFEVLPSRDQDGRETTVLLEGEDVTSDLSSPAVNQHVSAVSALPRVRAALIRQQRRLAVEGEILMAGRDIGTVVLPDARLKLFLTASPEERAQRRFLEQQSRGEQVTYQAALTSLQRRDRLDSSRRTAPLRAARDAIVIDTTRLPVSEVVDRVLAAVQAVTAKGTSGGTEKTVDGRG